jgi:S1-C subfamily serine protease
MGPRKPIPFSSPRSAGRGPQLRWDLEATLAAVVGLTSRVPENAFTASVLGTEREGSGVLIHERGLVLTIGYLVCEAEEVWLRTQSGRVIPAHPLACDFESGFGLVQAHADPGVPPVELGRSADLRVGAKLVMAAAGGAANAIETVLVGRREFAGYWEYLLDEALFVAPPHADWGGAALLDTDGHLVGIGSLMVQVGESRSPDRVNMAVPIDLLPPILDDLVNHGRRRTPPLPWLGLYLAETETGLVVMATAPGGPAARAGIEAGDRIFEIAGLPVAELADFYRQLRALGPAGVRVPLRVLRDDARFVLEPVSADRASFLRPPRLH